MKRLLKLLPVLAVFALGLFAGDRLRVAPEAGEVSAAQPVALSGYRFPAVFYVPIVRSGNLRSAMVLELGLNLTAAGQEAVSVSELQLRDEILRALMAHANTGGFDGNFTAVAHLDLLGEVLLTAAQRVLGPEVDKVLIVNIMKQSH